MPPRNASSLDQGELAQLGERLLCKQEVTGSSPVFSTSLRASALRLASQSEIGCRVRKGGGLVAEAP